MNLNIGCGNLPFDDCINVDKRRTELDAIQHDLERFPWPFPNNKFEIVYAYDIIEHLTDVIKTMEEIARVLKPGGRVEIRTCAWDKEQSYSDPTHKHFFTLNSFDFFDPTTWRGKKYDWYSTARFKIIRAQYDCSEIEFTLVKIIGPGDCIEDEKNLLRKYAEVDDERGV
jgi:ubiquinone/menaquinone biosynthesis C-methylase UbiE